MRREWCCQTRCLIDWFTGRVNDIAIGNIHEKRIATCAMPIYVWNIVPILLHVRYFQEKNSTCIKLLYKKLQGKPSFRSNQYLITWKWHIFSFFFPILSISTSPRHPARHLWISDLKRFQRQRAKEIPIIIIRQLYAMMDRLSFVDFAIPHISTRRLRTALNLDLIQQFYHIGRRKLRPTPTELDTTSNVLVYILDDMWKTLFFLFYREFRVFEMTNGIIDGNESTRFIMSYWLYSTDREIGPI